LVLPAQGGQRRHDVIGAVGGDAQIAAHKRFGARQQGAGFGFGREQAGGDGVKRLTGLGQVDRAGAALEQTNFVFFLELPDLGRDRGLADHCRLGGGRKPAFLSDQVKRAEL
jgi:hypothetical protein